MALSCWHSREVGGETFTALFLGSDPVAVIKELPEELKPGDLVKLRTDIEWNEGLEKNFNKVFIVKSAFSNFGNEYITLLFDLDHRIPKKEFPEWNSDRFFLVKAD